MTKRQNNKKIYYEQERLENKAKNRRIINAKRVMSDEDRPQRSSAVTELHEAFLENGKLPQIQDFKQIAEMFDKLETAQTGNISKGLKMLTNARDYITSFQTIPSSEKKFLRQIETIFNKHGKKLNDSDVAVIKKVYSNSSRWVPSVNKFRRALPKTRQEKMDNLSLRTDIDLYLQEVATGKQNRDGIIYPAIKLSKEQRENHRIFYNDVTGRLVNKDGTTATTKGKRSKNLQDVQTFIVDPEGNMYWGSHPDTLKRNVPSFNHGALANYETLSMAGMFNIEDGQITNFADLSGHYTPSALQCYEFIKRTNKTMPGVFAPNATVTISEGSNKPVPKKISQFMQEMDTVDKYKGKTKYEELKEEKRDEIEQYAKSIKNRTSFVIEETASKDIGKSIENLSPQKTQELAGKLADPKNNVIIVIKNPNADKFDKSAIRNFPVTELANDAILSRNSKLLGSLLEAGIGTNEDFQNGAPLLKAITHESQRNFQDEKLITELATDKNIREFLKAEA